MHPGTVWPGCMDGGGPEGDAVAIFFPKCLASKSMHEVIDIGLLPQLFVQ